MNRKTLLATGSSGLIGSEVCTYFTHELCYAVNGVDNSHHRHSASDGAYLLAALDRKRAAAA
jgi:nucleoside-diphosphate-sugar epimerase